MNPTTVQPYLFFGGRCEEALRFYERALGAKVEMLMKFSDSPEPPPPGMIAPGFESKVMHSSLRIGDSVIMASDGSNADEKSTHVSLSLSCTSNAEVDQRFAALSEGGQVMMPPGKTFWSPYFGMVRDRFGIGWMVGVEAPGAT
jgi:PhnB protein